MRALPGMSANCRQMGGRLVRFHSDHDSRQHHSLIHQHDPSRYEVLREYAPDSGRSTLVPIAELLHSAGVDLDAPSDSSRALLPCREWAANRTLRRAPREEEAIARGGAKGTPALAPSSLAGVLGRQSRVQSRPPSAHRCPDGRPPSVNSDPPTAVHQPPTPVRRPLSANGHLPTAICQPPSADRRLPFPDRRPPA